MKSNNRTMTEFQMQLLSEIFRIVVKEITCDEDKYSLAPGEMGINYTEGCFYIRDPHTGELFCPNSVAHIKQILTKYNSTNNTLNADYVSGIRFYSDISQLKQLGISMTADTVIRQMEYPAILISPIEYDNFAGMGFPSKSGVFTVHKISPECVTAEYYDNLTMKSYIGRYNPFRQFFEGWASNDPDASFVETIGGGNTASIKLPELPNDMDIIAVRVTEDLYAGATLGVNGEAALPICNKDGTALASTILANNIIMLIYDKLGNRWILTDTNESSTVAVVNILQSRVEDVSKKLDLAIADYQERFKEDRRYVNDQINYLKSRPGVISEVISTWTATSDNVDTISAITGFNPKYDRLIINYRQTILRNGIDYVIEEAGSVVFKEIRFSTGDILQFIVLKQPESAQ